MVTLPCALRERHGLSTPSVSWALSFDSEYLRATPCGRGLEHATNQDHYSTARVRRLGLRNLQADDYLMLNAVLWYTILCVALNEVASGGGSNLMTDEEKANLTDKIIAERTRGSKWVFVSEHAFILCVWSLKACMLVIYARITYVTGSET